MTEPTDHDHSSSADQPAVPPPAPGCRPYPKHQRADRYPATWHQRLIRFNILWLVTFLALMASLDTVLYAPTRLFTRSEPPQAPPVVLVSSNLRAGQVTINGQPQVETLPLLLRGQHPSYVLSFTATITIEAPPFQRKVCQVTLPDSLFSSLAAGSPCQVTSLEGMRPVTLHGVTARPTYWVYIPFSAADLLLDQQQAVTSLLAQTLTTEQHTLAPPGAVVVTGTDRFWHLTSQRASTALDARATVFPPAQLDPHLTYCGTPICPLGTPDTTNLLPPGAWSISVAVMLRWRFTTAAGTAFSEVALPAVSQVPLLLAYDPTAGWRVVQTAEGDLSPSAQRATQFATLLCLGGSEALRQHEGSGTILLLSDHGLEGCAFRLQAAKSEPTVFIWRFGVLLAANERAQAQWPGLPVATPADHAAVEG